MATLADYQLPDNQGEGAERYLRNNSAKRYSTMLSQERKRGHILRTLGLLAAIAIAAFAILSVVRACSITHHSFYLLLMGTDESIARNEDTSESSLNGVYRTDTMILARIDPEHKQATLISLPRDTKVNLPGYGTQKLNAAYAFGGQALAKRTVSDLAGVRVNHYAVVDMDGLRAVVDAIGGIDVYVPVTIDDPDAEGYLDAGWQTLDGAQTLVLCRSRNTFDYYDNPDGMRAANQRMVLQAIANKLLASDAATQASAIAALADSVSTDLSVADIVGLAGALSGMDTQTGLYTASMPTESVYEDDLWYETVQVDAWTTMMERVDAGLPPTEETIVDDYTGIVISNAG